MNEALEYYDETEQETLYKTPEGKIIAIPKNNSTLKIYF